METNTAIATKLCASKYAIAYPWVIRLDTNRHYRPKLSKRGYPHISFRSRKLGISQKVEVHRILAYQMWGDVVFSESFCVRHLNSDKSDFSKENLALGTDMDNYMDNPDGVKNAMAAVCKDNGKSLRKFTEEDVGSILAMRSNGATYSQIAREFNCGKSTIFYICKGRTYGELTRQGAGVVC